MTTFDRIMRMKPSELAIYMAVYMFGKDWYDERLEILADLHKEWEPRYEELFELVHKRGVVDENAVQDNKD